MTKILTLVDASVLIYAAKKPTAETFAIRSRALLILEDSEREFVSNELLRLETLPFAVFFKKEREVRFYKAFFDSVVHWADSTTLIPPAYEIACKYGVGAMDALHIAAAQAFDAEFVSAEKPTKPVYQAYKNISTIY